MAKKQKKQEVYPTVDEILADGKKREEKKQKTDGGKPEHSFMPVIRSTIIALLIIAALVFALLVWPVPDTTNDLNNMRVRVMGRIKERIEPDTAGNGWYQYSQASDLLQKKLEAITGTSSPVLVADDYPEQEPEHKETINTILSRGNDILKLADRGFDSPFFQMPVNLNGGPDGNEIRRLRNLGVFLVLSGRQAENNGDYATASKRYVQCLFMANGLAQNGNLLYCYSGYRLSEPAIEPLSELVQGDLKHGNYVGIIQNMKKVVYNYSDLRSITEAEAVRNEAAFEELETSGTIKGKNVLPAWVRGYSGTSLFKKYVRREKMIYGKAFVDFLNSISRRRYSIIKASINDMTPPPISRVSRRLLPDFIAVYNDYYYNRLRQEGIMLVAGLQAYKSEKGHYPHQLSDLFPEIISDIPVNPYSENLKFKYIKSDDGIALYSFGKNLTDNGGSSEKSRNGTLDIVFINTISSLEKPAE